MDESTHMENLLCNSKVISMYTNSLEYRSNDSGSVAHNKIQLHWQTQSWIKLMLPGRSHFIPFNSPESFQQFARALSRWEIILYDKFLIYMGNREEAHSLDPAWEFTSHTFLFNQLHSIPWKGSEKRHWMQNLMPRYYVLHTLAVAPQHYAYNPSKKDKFRIFFKYLIYSK